MNEFWSGLLQNLIMAFVPVLASMLTAWLIAQTRLVWQKFRNAQPDITDQVEWAARTAVSAAEQAGAAKLIEDKREYAIGVADMWLNSKGLKVDIEMIEAAIEAAVWSEINQNKPKPAAGPVE